MSAIGGQNLGISTAQNTQATGNVQGAAKEGNFANTQVQQNTDATMPMAIALIALVAVYTSQNRQACASNQPEFDQSKTQVQQTSLQGVSEGNQSEGNQSNTDQLLSKAVSLIESAIGNTKAQSTAPAPEGNQSNTEQLMSDVLSLVKSAIGETKAQSTAPAPEGNQSNTEQLMSKMVSLVEGLVGNTKAQNTVHKHHHHHKTSKTGTETPMPKTPDDETKAPEKPATPPPAVPEKVGLPPQPSKSSMKVPSDTNLTKHAQFGGVQPPPGAPGDKPGALGTAPGATGGAPKAPEGETKTPETPGAPKLGETGYVPPAPPPAPPPPPTGGTGTPPPAAGGGTATPTTGGEILTEPGPVPPPPTFQLKPFPEGGTTSGSKGTPPSGAAGGAPKAPEGETKTPKPPASGAGTPALSLAEQIAAQQAKGLKKVADEDKGQGAKLTEEELKQKTKEALENKQPLPEGVNFTHLIKWGLGKPLKKVDKAAVEAEKKAADEAKKADEAAKDPSKLSIQDILVQAAKIRDAAAPDDEDDGDEAYKDGDERLKNLTNELGKLDSTKLKKLEAAQQAADDLYRAWTEADDDDEEDPRPNRFSDSQLPPDQVSNRIQALRDAAEELKTANAADLGIDDEQKNDLVETLEDDANWASNRNWEYQTYLNDKY